MTSIKILNFILPSKTKPAAKHANKKAASIKSTPLLFDTNSQANASNKAPTSSLSTKGKAAEVPFASAPSAKLAIPKKMAPSYYYKSMSIPRVPFAKVISLSGGFFVNLHFTPKGISFAKEPLKAMLIQHILMVNNLKTMYFATIANLCSSIDKPVSVLQQLGELMPGHQFTFNEFYFLTTFCDWNSPFNFANAPTSSLTLFHWLKFVQQNSAFTNLSVVINSESSNMGPGMLEESSTTSGTSEKVP
ncbi:hypothetical protein GYMLUDRAFT_244865 [Collybiopsis luxurians FD-317 M1]|uniref:Uncharacterized protein n=1 Tax=Collybiopsis luxurians FD-317 M1 TaxID=944289 RepID=A0A0D0B7Y8_9AGAR|nr:hypothetical protein GYMLUDRAFT_244865 [Collybiopsis luxurians FD-317 M1]